MIGALSGTVSMVGEEAAIIEVQGVGYEIAATSRFLSRLTRGAAVSCAIETMVREDFIRLYAFASDPERQCFRLLQSVQGVGAKAALAILQIHSPADLFEAIVIEDVTSIARAQGIGKKIATRIVTELQGKLPSSGLHSGPDIDPSPPNHASPLDEVAQEPPARGPGPKSGKKTGSEEKPPRAGQAQQDAQKVVPIAATRRLDAVSALVNLGYDAHHARDAVKIAHAETPEATVEALIRLSLKSLARA